MLMHEQQFNEVRGFILFEMLDEQDIDFMSNMLRIFK